MFCILVNGTFCGFCKNDLTHFLTELEMDAPTVFASNNQNQNLINRKNLVQVNVYNDVNN